MTLGDDSRRGAESFVPVARPLLPSADAIFPYLRFVDESRQYTNSGPLVRLFECRLAALLELDSVVSASSGTTALTAAILAAAGKATPSRPYCLCPSYTFVATACAAEQCGYRLHFVDIDERTWMPDPDILAGHPLLEQTGLILVTAPYGRCGRPARWERLAEGTGVPVVIDAAAGADTLAATPQLIGSIPLVLSLHATKAFGVGEGGAILSRDPDLLDAARAALNYGIASQRQISAPGLNGKMSEYHAAVGLAELDGWSAKLACLRRVADRYRSFGLPIHVAPAVSSCYALFEAENDEEASLVQTSLTEAAIECRCWYGSGLHKETCFRAFTADALPVTSALAGRIIGLPVAPDLTDALIDRVALALTGLLRAAPPERRQSGGHLALQE